LRKGFENQLHKRLKLPASIAQTFWKFSKKDEKGESVTFEEGFTVMLIYMVEEDEKDSVEIIE